jgi:hypothetical protein
MKALTEFDAEIKAPILPLTFLLSEERRVQQRSRMPGISDSAIFHRLWHLFGIISVTENRKLLDREEEEALAKFLSVYGSLPWEPLQSHPHISELESDDLSPLLPVARDLISVLERRTKKRWWQW